MFKEKKMFTTKPGLPWIFLSVFGFIHKVLHFDKYIANSPSFWGVCNIFMKQTSLLATCIGKNLNYYKYACLCAFPKLTHIVSCYITQGSI